MSALLSNRSGVVSPLQRQRHADAGGGEYLVLLELHRSSCGGGKMARKGLGLHPAADVVLHDDELVAAELRHHVVDPDRSAQTLGDAPEQKVAAVSDQAYR